MSSPVLTGIKKDLATSNDFQRTMETIGRGESVVWNGCVGSSYAFLGGVVSDETRRPILVVVSKVGDVERAANDLAFFTDSPILTYPVLPETLSASADEMFLSEDADFGKRLRILKLFDELATEENRKSNVSNIDAKAPVVVSSLTALLQRVPSREQIVDDSISLDKGGEFGRDELIRWLVDGKFTSTPAVELPGEYSVRGDIVDVYAIDWDNPVRFEFFGDELESIRTFDIVSQRSLDDLDSVRISRLSVHGAFESRFVDRLPSNIIIFIVDTDAVVAETTRLVADRSKNHSASVSETINALYCYPTVHVVNVAFGGEYASLTVDAHFFSIERFQGDFTHVEKVFKELSSEERVLIACASETEGRRLETTFQNSSPGLEKRLSFSVGTISSGFEWRDRAVYFVGSDQLFGRTISRRTRGTRKRNLSKTVDSFMELTPNDYVIHEDYGLARYLGVETIKKANQTEDHLKLEFARNVYVYVPASKIRKIQRYVGVGGHKVRLSTYKGKAWNSKKAEARQAIWAYAHEMIEVQAARDSLQGVEFPPDDEMQQDFESLFPYRETDDQLTAIEDVKKDMERSRPMDRLLCGDVGFGKTEVALRAVFKAVEAGYQVAVLAPTTVLVEQHYRTFRDRTSAFPVRIATLSRYSSPKEQHETIAKLSDGDVDIVIGTHRLLSKDVSFKKLGLIVIDEEQKFGVVHKERLKKLRATVDILTMTATPIPRTLHLSLLGVRDISSLETPPEDRLPVETKVLRFDDEIVRIAFLRELNRGGQIYYLHNRINDIEDVAEKLHKIVPEARIRVGHAQMSSEELETTMRDFVLRRFDVLVCTTIIESGLDIPNANTIFIDNANMFGLAELHQLRGRVGREKKQAYCFLMLEPNKTISTQGKQRLNAIQEYNRLGSGFQIAMRDLEIRGAGNILGTQQSGHIEAIGYEMYCEMLEAAVRMLKSEPQKLRVDVEIDLPISAVLDSRYIRDSRSRIDFYRRFDRVESFEQGEALREELKDRFGNLPPEAERIFELSIIRVLAFKFRVKKIQLIRLEGLLDHSKMLEIEFRAIDQKFKLKELLEKRGINLQFVDGTPCGYVNLPRDIFDKKGEANPEMLIEFVTSLFRYSPQELNEPEEQLVLENAKRQIRPTETRDHEGNNEERKAIQQPLRAKLLKNRKKRE